MTEENTAAAADDPELTVRLPYTAWTQLIQAVSTRPYGEVYALMTAITAQLVPQIEAAAVRTQSASALAAETMQ